MQIHELPTISGSPSGGYFATDNGTQTTKIDYTALAQAIIEQYNASTLAGSAQSVKAALDGVKADSVLTRGAFETVTASTNINDYTTPGTYFFNSSTKAVNAPGNSGYFRLVVTAPAGVVGGTNRVRYQEAVTSDGLVFTRLLNSSDAGVTWTAGNWTKLRSSSWAVLDDARVSTALTTYIDNLTPGVYYLHSATADATTVGAPTGAWYFYEIRKHGPEHVVITATRGSTNGRPFIYQKCKYGSAWDSEWQLMPTRAEVDALTTNIGNFTCTREVISAASTQTYTLTHSHMYLVTVARGSNADDSTAGLYVVTAYNAAGLCKTISASSLATVSINKTTLTITTTAMSVLVSIMQIA